MDYPEGVGGPRSGGRGAKFQTSQAQVSKTGITGLSDRFGQVEAALSNALVSCCVDACLLSRIFIPHPSLDCLGVHLLPTFSHYPDLHV